MANREIKVGQQYQRIDTAGLVFEVVERVMSINPPHIRVRRIDDPTDQRVFSIHALADRHLFRAVSAPAAAVRAAAGLLRFGTT